MARRSASSLLGLFVGAAGGCATAALADTTQHKRMSYPRGDAAAEYPDLSGHYSLMAAVLTPDLYARNLARRTAKGVTLDGVIQAGVDNPGHPAEDAPGCFAGDEESFYVFRELLNPVLDLKFGWKSTDRQVTDLNPANSKAARLNPQYVVGVRVRASRNLSNHRFAPVIRRGERREVEVAILHACKRLSTPFQGAYQSLTTLSEHDLEQGISLGYLFPKPTAPLLLTAGFDRDWPMARGAYVNKTKTFMVWINEQDHMRVIAAYRGGDLPLAFNNVCMALLDLESGLLEMGKSYAHDENLGFLGPALSNVGTGLKVTLQAKFPNLVKHPEFESFLKKHDIESTVQPIGGVIDLSNTRRLGVTETKVVDHMGRTAEKMIAYEKALEDGKRIKLL